MAVLQDGDDGLGDDGEQQVDEDEAMINQTTYSMQHLSDYI